MIKKLLLNALIFSGLFASAQTFTATYDFASTTSLTGVTDPSVPPAVTGITCGSFVAVGTPSANPNAASRFSFVGWPTGAPNGATTYSAMTGSISTSEYYEVTLTPTNGNTITLNTIGLKVQRSGTGIKSYAVRSSVDTYSANLPATVSSNTNIIIEGSNEFFIVPDASASYSGSLIDLTATTFSFTNATSFRFYGWNSEAAGGTFSIDDVVFDGIITGTATPCASPTISAITGNTVICSNQSLNLSSTVLGDAPFTYTWTGAGTIATPNASNTAITGVTATDYNLTVENACGTATSVVTATVNASPTVSVTSVAICAGNSATLTASSSTTLTYLWNTSDATANIVVTPTLSPIDYTVTGTDANGCYNSAVASVTLYATPSVSLNLTPNLQCVTANIVTLAGGFPASGIYSGTAVTGGNFSPSTAGVGSFTIMYTYTDANNCEAVATDIMTVDGCTGIQTISADLFSIYPNPSNGLLVVKTPVLNAQVNVFDVNGKKVFTQTTASFENQLDLSNLTNGIYQLNIVSDNQSFNHKIMISK